MSHGESYCGLAYLDSNPTYLCLSLKKNLHGIPFLPVETPPPGRKGQVSFATLRRIFPCMEFQSAWLVHLLSNMILPLFIYFLLDDIEGDSYFNLSRN